MIFAITFAVDLFSMAACLWLAFYLFARGYPNRATMQAALVLLALSLYFLSAYNNLFQQTTGATALRAVLLVVGTTCWYGTTFHLLPQDQQNQLGWMKVGTYLLCIITIILLLTNSAVFIEEIGTELSAVPTQMGPPFFFYEFTIFIIPAFVLFNLWINHRARRTSQGRLLFLASSFPIVITVYRFISVLADYRVTPRLVQDVLIFSGVFLFGMAVASYQSMLERRAILDEFPLTAAIVGIMAFLYGLIGIFGAFPISALGNVITSLIMTIGFYDLGREILDRRRIQTKSRFRRQLRTLENESSNEDKSQRLLQEGLDLLCETLNAAGGLVAVCREGKTFIVASQNSIEVGSELVMETKDEELWRYEGQIQNVEWISSIFEGQKLIALAGMGLSRNKMDYSSSDLELFTEFADHIGTIVSIGNPLPFTKSSVHGSIMESQVQEVKLDSAAEMMMDTLSGNVEGELVKMVEDALRKFSDFIALGQSPLALWLEVDEDAYIERGKKMQTILREAVEILRPFGTRPIDPIPRSWYSYVVLHDAYLEGAPNRDVIARLYISEATFHRTRRSALRGLARWIADTFRDRDKK